jgi:hypothetical protein
VDRAEAVVAARTFWQQWRTLDEIPDRVIVDPLHVLKWFRYRLLNCQSRNGFDPDSPLANVSQCADELVVPSAMLSNQPLTKM